MLLLCVQLYMIFIKCICILLSMLMKMYMNYKKKIVPVFTHIILINFKEE